MADEQEIELQQKKLELQEKLKNATQELVKLDAEKLKQEGNFITKKREQLIELNRQKQLMDELSKIFDIQQNFEREVLRLKQLQKQEQELQNRLKEIQATSDEKDAQAQLRIERTMDRISSIQSQINNAKISMVDINTKIGNSEVENVKILTEGIKSEEERVRITTQIRELYRQIRNGQITPEEFDAQRKAVEKTSEAIKKMENRFQGIEDAAEAGFRKTAELFGISTDFSAKFDELVNSFKDANFEDISTRFASAFKSVFNTINLVGTLGKAVFEQLMEVVGLQAELTKETGLGQEFIFSFTEARDRANDLTGSLVATRAEAMEVGAELAQSLPVFTALGQTARTEISAIGLRLSAVNVNIGDFSNAVMDLAAVTGDTFVGAAKQVESLAEEFIKFGITPKDAVANFAQLQPKFANLGRQGTQTFISLTKKAKALNVEISDILNITEVFDTFENAIPTTMNLNAIFGKLTGSMGSYFNATELVMEQDPDKRFDMLRKSVESTGVSLSELANGTTQQRMALKALSQAMGGMEIDEMIKKFDSANDSTLNSIESQKSFNDIIKESKSFSDMLKATFEEIISSMDDMGINFVDIAQGIKSFVIGVVEFIKEFPNLSKALMFLPFVAPLITAGFGMITTAVGLFSAAQTKAAIESNAASLASLKQGKSAVITGEMNAAGSLGVNKMSTAFTGLMKSLGMVALFVAVAYGAFQIFDTAAAALHDTLGPVVTTILAFAAAVGLAYVAATAGLGAAGIAAGAAALGASIVGFKSMVGGYEGEEEPIETFPGLKDGGTIGTFPQTAIVGEEGPEIVTLPPRSRVYSHGDSKNIAADSGFSSIAAYKDGSDDYTEFLQSPSSQFFSSLGMDMDPFARAHADEQAAVKGEATSAHKALAKQIAKELKPVLQEAMGSMGGSDIVLDGKKVGKQLAPRMVKATERKMSRTLIGG
jgi:hypothetical protein